MKRRTVLLGGAGAAGALAIGWSALPTRQRLLPSEPMAVREGQVALNGWVKIGADNSVTVVMPRSEMGQGVHTGLAMLLAEELDADWSRMRIEAAPVDGIYRNLAVGPDALPFHPDDEGTLRRTAEHLAEKTMREIGVIITGGSTSVRDLWLPMREAGASARAMLLAAAASQWGVPEAECSTASGKLLHGPTGRSAFYGEFAARAGQGELPRKPALKDAARFTRIGQPLPRLEAAAKLDGSARFGIDVLPDGLLYASVVMCPTLGGRVRRLDPAPAQAQPGVKAVLALEGRHGASGAVAVIADRPWRALRAVQAVPVEWDEGPAAGFDSDTVHEQLARALDSEDGLTYRRRGDVEAALRSAAKTLTAEYRAPFLAHAAMEPMNCTVQFKDGRAVVWASTQVPDLARRVAARALDIDAEQVEVRVQFLGGGFGRRLDVDFVVQAAQIARAAAGAPVQTIWSREQDTTHDMYRPACVARLAAGLDAEGRPVAWRHRSASPSVVQQALGRLYGLPALAPDKTTIEGAFDQPYEWPALSVAHTTVNLPVPVGFWRSVGHSHQAFFKECFVDELAAAAGQDPVDFRAALLAQHPRHRHVLERAAALAGWGNAPAPAADGAPVARGVALHESFGSIVAQVAEVSLSPERAIRVHRVVCAIDCGLAVNPNLVRQQMESGIVFGLSAALHGEITIRRGRVQQSNFHDVPMLRIGDCPLIETEVVVSSAPPEGVGEPGTPPIAPAVGNALFALTGQRLRSLPLRLAAAS